MGIAVADAVQSLEGQGLIRRHPRDDSARIIRRVRDLIGQELPSDLAAFYGEHISSIGDFRACAPVWNDHVGWRPSATAEPNELLHVQAVPLALDGCGNLFGADLTAGDHPGVYFFDSDDGYEYPHYAVGSSIGSFLLLLAEHDRAIREDRPAGWELSIDPDIGRCPRAPPIWLAD